MKTTITAGILATSFAAAAPPAHADWFARLNSGNKLVLTGVATDENGILSAITLTCDSSRLKAEIPTLQNASKDELSTYKYARLTIVPELAVEIDVFIKAPSAKG
ncbi:hypothetical protein [Sinorhizobium saheli]|jgi:hypothetical protein|uniref:Lipid/polyisoprenoid-binding YceI-like domain-containing protein n=1 Tax=Sinorhizobium saheli TaxID=36856 RepID=A0A178YT36_SINSA|nr:hypothetical protein [Sinorhizobium saheli]MQW90246.1 hypothetical protein [Sinorhizobium saheli]OAP50537.1 hypothetical protein ATB98_10130 [Sinorhizobium saheli]